MRHAEKEMMGDDPSLSTRGTQQAQGLVRALSTLGPRIELLISPKHRTRQTLQPFAEKSAQSLKVENALDERRSGESSREFSQRVETFLDGLQKKSSAEKPGQEGVVVICSHMDWLQHAVLYVASSEESDRIGLSWPCAHTVTFRCNASGWTLL
jgi:broad specificity phosphatase PhoE